MNSRIFLVGLLLFAAPAIASCQSPKKAPLPKLANILPLLNANSPEALSGVLRGAVIKHLPNPIYEATPNWGHQDTVRRLRFRRRGIVLRPRLVKVSRNDGTWRRIVFTSISLPNTLVLDIRNVAFPEPSRMTFEVFLAFDGRAEVTQQNWERGIRLWSGSVKARFRAKVHLHCEATTRLEPKQKSILPDAVFRLRATSAKVSYDNLVYEHIPGIGGTTARVLGKLFHEALEQWHPSLERRMLEKANAAIVRSADIREVRISLSRVFNQVLGKKD